MAEKKKGEKGIEKKKNGEKKRLLQKKILLLLPTKYDQKGYQKSHHIRKDVFTPKNGAQICASNEDNLKRLLHYNHIIRTFLKGKHTSS